MAYSILTLYEMMKNSESAGQVVLLSDKLPPS